MSNEPVVWRTTIAGIVSAAVSAGLLTGVQAQHINAAAQVLVPVAAFLLPLVAGVLARRKVTPVAAVGEHRLDVPDRPPH